ncbi:uncharacterized protein EV154DRAFT_604745 [Mucor mucedo]|uniref:uncharacterized protein n=1 Tax=Mucor mucedo TaxID=29922 RepID=UPI00221FC10C|nr:uncharacterized protein EV154DRAFT_604745 [Mucor mucedo]KAI7888558.1 hypothetical protein EV154DRAFT_604745 [Mucor mucedo]
MSNWSQLPTELLIKIFELLESSFFEAHESQREISQQMLVCKNWCRIAKMLLYKDVTMLSIKQHDAFLTCMSHYSTGMNQLVLSFKACSEITNSKLEKDLGLILSALPNLQQLDAKPQKGSFFTRLLLELYSSTDRPTQLVTIPTFTTESEQYATSYQYAAWALKKTLKYMVLPDWCIKPYSISTPLEEFKNLTDLELRISSLSQMNEIGTIASRCTNLISLNLACKTRTNQITEDQSKAIDTTCVQPVLHILILRINASVVTASPESMRILMRLFPQVKKWEMYESSHRAIKDQSMEIPTELWVQFLVFLNKITLVYCPCLYISSLDQVLKELSNNTGLCKEIKVKYNHGHTHNSRGDILRILPFHGIGAHDDDRHDTIVSYVPSESDALPHESLIEKIGFQLEHLTMNLNKVFKRGAISNARESNVLGPFGYFINHIFKHCPVLKSLVITEADLLHCNHIDLKAPPSFKLLHLRNCKFFHGVDFLSDLSHRLPSRMEFMVIDQCIFVLRKNELMPHIEMPFTVFGCLFYSKKKLPEHKYSSMVIKITKVSQKPLYYRLYDKQKLETLSTKEEFELCAEYEQTTGLEITCSDIEKLLIRAYGFRILIFPKEQVEYMDGQNYINSSFEFRHVET